jgi:hypothetical protein
LDILRTKSSFGIVWLRHLTPKKNCFFQEYMK